MIVLEMIETVFSYNLLDGCSKMKILEMIFFEKKPRFKLG